MFKDSVKSRDWEGNLTVQQGRGRSRVSIAHCVHGLGLGGAQQIIKLIVRGRTSKHLRYWVYSCEDGVFRGEVEDAGAIVRILPRRLPKFDPSWVATLASAMRTDRIDVVHTHLFGDSFHGYLAARRAGNVPVVMTLHNGTYAHTRLQRLGYRWLLPRTARNVACTESARRSWAALAAAAGATIETIPNGIEVPKQQPLDQNACDDLKADLGIARGTTVIGTVGRMVEQKGYAYLLGAFAQLSPARRTSVSLVLVGDGPLRAALQREAEREGIGKLVLFPGFRADVPQLMQVFDIVAFSSLFEGLPIALLEAMASARCIVGTTAEGIVDAVSDRREALIVPAKDPSALRAGLEALLDNPELRRRLGEAAQRKFLADFTADRMVKRYENVYREVYAARYQQRHDETARDAAYY